MTTTTSARSITHKSKHRRPSEVNQQPVSHFAIAPTWPTNDPFDHPSANRSKVKTRMHTRQAVRNRNADAAERLTFADAARYSAICRTLSRRVLTYRKNRVVNQRLFFPSTLISTRTNHAIKFLFAVFSLQTTLFPCGHFAMDDRTIFTPPLVSVEQRLRLSSLFAA